MLTVKHNGTVFANMTPEALAQKGVPQSVIATAMADMRRKAISSECRSRIYATASAEAQMNMATAAAVIAGREPSARSPDDENTLEGVHAALGWVKAMRAAVLTLAEDTDTDFTADAAWPALPAEVNVLIAQF